MKNSGGGVGSELLSGGCVWMEPQSHEHWGNLKPSTQCLNAQCQYRVLWDDYSWTVYWCYKEQWFLKECVDTGSVQRHSLFSIGFWPPCSHQAGTGKPTCVQELHVIVPTFTSTSRAGLISTSVTWVSCLKCRYTDILPLDLSSLFGGQLLALGSILCSGWTGSCWLTLSGALKVLLLCVGPYL